jgi:hypothetical protein
MTEIVVQQNHVDLLKMRQCERLSR